MGERDHRGETVYSCTKSEQKKRGLGSPTHNVIARARYALLLHTGIRKEVHDES